MGELNNAKFITRDYPTERKKLFDRYSMIIEKMIEPDDNDLQQITRIIRGMSDDLHRTALKSNLNITDYMLEINTFWVTDTKIAIIMYVKEHNKN